MQLEPRAKDHTQEMTFVVFKLREDEFGAPVQQVHEVLRRVELTRVPRAPHWIEGVINLRGRVMPVMDLRRRFDLPLDAPEAKQRIMEIEINRQAFGVIVDEVREVLRIPVRLIEPAPTMIASIAGEYLEGVARMDERILMLLNFDKLLTPQEIRAVVEQPTEWRMAPTLPSAAETARSYPTVQED
jgi:purine-binding chemotaxis protein CheW